MRIDKFYVSFNTLLHEFHHIISLLPSSLKNAYHFTSFDSIDQIQFVFTDKIANTSVDASIQNTSLTPLVDNYEFMQFLEFKFLLKNMKINMLTICYSAINKCDTVSADISINEDNKPIKENRTTNDQPQLCHRLQFIDKLIKEVNDLIAERIELTRQLKLILPRILRLCEEYELNDIETEAFYLVAVIFGSRQFHILQWFLDEDYTRRTTGLQRLCALSEVDLEFFCNSERLHIKEGMLLVEEDQGIFYNLRIPRTAIQLCYGRNVKADDMLIISQTCMEDILAAETNESSNFNLKSPSSTKMHKRTRIGNYSPSKSSSKRPRVLQSPGKVTMLSELNSTYEGEADDEEIVEYYDNASMDGDDIGDDNNIFQSIETSKSQTSSTFDDINFTVKSTEIEEYQPYPSHDQLEYLEEGFSLIALLVRSNAARIKDDMKKEGTKMNNYWDTGEVKQGKRELHAKIQLLERKLIKRVEITSKLKLEIPRLEILSQRLGLDLLEKKIIILLIGKTVSPVVRTLMETLDSSGSSRGISLDEGISVGQALNILCQDFHTQIANRKYFYKSSKLMSHGIISLSKSRWHQGHSDLTEQRIQLDRRVLDWTVGLDSEINELVEGSDLYEPKNDLSQIVLPKGHLDQLLTLCESYDYFLKYRELDVSFKEKLSYGNSLVILLCGKPGTGKTMTVNAMAKTLGKKVLLVDFSALTGKQSESSGSSEIDLRGLFRESSMNNAIIFFDECESIFKSRSHGNDRLLNTMLTEIERYSGIVFLATNLAYELDEAMHRRITCVIEYKPPDHNLRKQIWENLLGVHVSNTHMDLCQNSDLVVTEAIKSIKDSMLTNDDEGKIKSIVDKIAPNLSTIFNRFKLSSDVDIDAISVKYELTGGFIKNAVLSSILFALNRNHQNPVIVQADLISGCKLQMRGSLIQRSFEERMETFCGIDKIHTNSDIKLTCQSILRFEKAREKIYGTTTNHYRNKANGNSQPLLTVDNSFQTSEIELQQKACMVTLVGPSGSGKKTVAQALAHSLGRSIKQLHVADILSSNMNTTLSSVRTMLQDARLADAVFVFDGFEHILDEQSNLSSNEGSFKLHLLLSRLLDILHNFPGLVILICHFDSPQRLNLEREFAMKLFACIRFVMPTSDVRAKIWFALLPKNVVISSSVSLIDLGKRFELYPASIASAISRAVAESAIRVSSRDDSVNAEVVIQQKDFLSAAEAEVEKLRSGNFDLISKLFT